MKLPVLSFRIKVALLLSMVVLLLGVIAVINARNDMRRILGTELERRGEAIAKDLAASSVAPLLTADLYGLYELVNRTKINNLDIRYILIVAPGGDTRVNTFGERVPRGLVEANVLSPGLSRQVRRLKTEEGVIRDIAVPILGARGGTVRVGMSDRNVEVAVAQNSQALVLLVAVAVVLGLIVSYWLAYYLTRPLSQLLRAVQSVGGGNLSQRIPSPGGDEVGQLAQAFNVMTEALAQKEAARRSLLEKVISSQEEERKRVARELHDELAQQLTSVLLSLERVESRLQDIDEESRRAVRRARQVTESSLAETRKLIGDLRPSVLDDLGLVPALRSYAETHLHPSNCRVVISAVNMRAELPSTVDTAVYRIAQEAINNIAKHAHATSAKITLRMEDGVLWGEVSDDGQGFRLLPVKTPTGPPTRGLGLQGMQERAALLGGKLFVWSEEGKGTRVSFSIPLHWGKDSGKEEDPYTAGG
ncbi:MAG: HAMP domain-containing protein [Chloroflexi bacterium]|nr:HAMP domain-containing protein [Chloroflexota bacterium]